MSAAVETLIPPNLTQTTDFWDVSKRSVQVQRRGRYVPEPENENDAEARLLKAGRTWPDVAGAVIDTYSQPGDWIFDPMAGTGVTLVEGIWRKRHAMGVELSEIRAAFARQHLELADQYPGNGRWHLLVGDARQLPPLPVRPRLVIIDPPFSQTRQDGGRSRFGGALGNYSGEDRNKSRSQRDQRNVGNLKHHQYLAEMLTIYQLCHAVCEPGGVMAVILKDFRKEFRRIDLLGDTRRVCEMAGWRYYDRATLYLGTASDVQRHNAKENNNLVPVTQDLLVFKKSAASTSTQSALPLLI